MKVFSKIETDSFCKAWERYLFKTSMKIPDKSLTDFSSNWAENSVAAHYEECRFYIISPKQSLKTPSNNNKPWGWGKSDFQGWNYFIWFSMSYFQQKYKTHKETGESTHKKKNKTKHSTESQWGYQVGGHIKQSF